jgi:hypothetical protein
MKDMLEEEDVSHFWPITLRFGWHHMDHFVNLSQRLLLPYYHQLLEQLCNQIHDSLYSTLSGQWKGLI